MTEIIMPIIAYNFRKTKKHLRRPILEGLAERLAPLSKGAIGLMIDHNNLEQAMPVIRRLNEKARQDFVHRAAEYVRVNHRAFPNAFVAPFHHDPAHPDVEEGKWGTMIKEAFNAHL